MASIKIKNLNALKDSMANMLYTWSMESAAGDSVQKDMYLYMHEDGTAHVEEFTNLGHSDYREDDHILLYSYQSNADLWECMQLSDTCAPDVAAVCGIPVEELEDRVVAWLENDGRHEEATEAWQEFIPEYLTECPDAEDLQTAALQHYGDWLIEETDNFEATVNGIIEENGLEQADE